MFAQVDDEGNRHILFEEIVDHRTDGSEVKQQDAFLTTCNGNKHRRETTKGWEILILWKNGSSTWATLKDMKNSYPVQLTEYAMQRRIAGERAFAWWIQHVLSKRNRIIGNSSQSIGYKLTSLESRSRSLLQRRYHSIRKTKTLW
jgi:hypothetical protein